MQKSHTINKDRKIIIASSVFTCCLSMMVTTLNLSDCVLISVCTSSFPLAHCLIFPLCCLEINWKEKWINYESVWRIWILYQYPFQNYWNWNEYWQHLSLVIITLRNIFTKSNQFFDRLTIDYMTPKTFKIYVRCSASYNLPMIHLRFV